MESRYDPPTAITFLLAGLGLGAVLALVLAPRPEYGSVSEPEFRGLKGRREARSAGAV